MNLLKTPLTTPDFYPHTKLHSLLKTQRLTAQVFTSENPPRLSASNTTHPSHSLTQDPQTLADFAQVFA